MYLSIIHTVKIEHNSPPPPPPQSIAVTINVPRCYLMNCTLIAIALVCVLGMKHHNTTCMFQFVYDTHDLQLNLPVLANIQEECKNAIIL